MVYLLVFLVIWVASFLFAMLGLGGGMVYVPVLKWSGFPVKEVAIPLGLLLNGLNTLLALIPYARHKLVDWRGGATTAAAAFVAAGLDSDFTEGIERAKDSIDSGRAREKLDSLVRLTNECKNFARDEPWGVRTYIRD